MPEAILGIFKAVNPAAALETAPGPSIGAPV